MSIDEHFWYMIILESVLFLAGFGISALVIHIGQRKQMKQIDDIVNNKEYAATIATNMLFQTMERIRDNKEDQEVFFGFVQHCGAHAFAGAKAAVGDVVGGGVDLPKRHALKPFEGILNQVLPGLFENAKKKAKATAAEEAGAAGVPGW